MHCTCTRYTCVWPITMYTLEPATCCTVYRARVSSIVSTLIVRTFLGDVKRNARVHAPPTTDNRPPFLLVTRHEEYRAHHDIKPSLYTHCRRYRGREWNHLTARKLRREERNVRMLVLSVDFFSSFHRFEDLFLIIEVSYISSLFLIYNSFLDFSKTSCAFRSLLVSSLVYNIRRWRVSDLHVGCRGKSHRILCKF